MDTFLAAVIVLTCMSFAALMSAMVALADINTMRRRLDALETRVADIEAAK